ncbi:MAG: DUF6152 family protein [Woeseiaceae bacterium]
MRAFVVILSLVFSVAAFAHHSVAGFFDPDTSVEIEGTVKIVRWRNPHTVFEVDVRNPDGEVITWRIESGALGVLRSRGIGREFIKVGDEVRIMGDSSLRSDREMFARNILLSDGKEVMMTAGSAPYFSVRDDGSMLEAEYDEDIISAAKETAVGLFRVWSTNIEVRPSGGRILPNPLPLTAAAKAKRADYDAGDEALLGCTEWSMPRLMMNPLPMEFVQEGDVILQRFEENDSVRRIHMGVAAGDRPDEFLRFGYSTGEWDETTLVVTTTQVSPDRFDNAGTPFSSEMRLVERFSPSDDGDRLDYTLVVSDPKTFTEPFEVKRYWEWRPEITVGAYDCERDQSLSAADLK